MARDDARPEPEALLAEAARRDLGVQAIKVGAHQPWGDREPPLAVDAGIGRTWLEAK